MTSICALRKCCFAMLVLLLPLVGCSTDEDLTADTTPEPTPVPIDSYYRATSIYVADSSESLDLNGDGAAESNAGLASALETISSTIYDSIYLSLCSGTVPCTEEEEAILDAFQDILDTLFSLETISTVINKPIEDGNVVYLMHLDGSTGGELTLEWSFGAFDGTAFSSTSSIGIQTGTLEGDSGTFSADDVTVTLSFEVPDPRTGSSQVKEVTLTLYDWVTELYGFTDSRFDFRTGAALSLNDLLELIEGLLTELNSALEPSGESIDVEAILEQITTAVAPYLNVDIDGDGTLDGIAVIISGSADGVAVVE